ncbi:hypothetical protein G6F42_016375 [Rhizopus arrhizus]|nr:hypothetical protein G6F42_016375 [Rhizopus arrhizus]
MAASRYNTTNAEKDKSATREKSKYPHKPNEDFETETNYISSGANKRDRNETIKGFITLTGSHITKAELQIKLANYHQDSPIKATITNTVPYFLEQAQQAINYISLAMNRVEAFTMPSYKQATIELLEDMYQYVDRALHAFDYPNEALLFPYKVCHPKVRLNYFDRLCPIKTPSVF